MVFLSFNFFVNEMPHIQQDVLIYLFKEIQQLVMAGK